MSGRSNTTDNRNHHRTMHTLSAFGLHVDEDDLFKSDKEEEEDIERWKVHQARCRSVWRMGGIHPLSIFITKSGLNGHFSRTRTVLQITFHYPQQPRTIFHHTTTEEEEELPRIPSARPSAVWTSIGRYLSLNGFNSKGSSTTNAPLSHPLPNP